MSDLGFKIKEYRRLHGMSQTDLADLIGVSKSHVSKWEHNIVKPNYKHTKALSEVMGEDLTLYNEADDYKEFILSLLVEVDKHTPISLITSTLKRMGLIRKGVSVETIVSMLEEEGFGQNN